MHFTCAVYTQYLQVLCLGITAHCNALCCTHIALCCTRIALCCTHSLSFTCLSNLWAFGREWNFKAHKQKLPEKGHLPFRAWQVFGVLGNTQTTCIKKRKLNPRLVWSSCRRMIIKYLLHEQNCLFPTKQGHSMEVNQIGTFSNQDDKRWYLKKGRYLSIEALRQLAIIKTTLKMQLIKFDFSWFWAENRLVVPAGDQWIQILVFEFHIRKNLFANSTTTICVGQDSKDTINFTWFRTEKQWKQACHAKYQIQVFEYPVPMPVSPSWVSGISARHFQNCLGFDKLWILRVWPATFKYQTGRKIRNQGTPSTMQACSFFSNLLLEFCFSTPAFSSTILLHKLVQAFDTLKIPTGSQEASVPTWNPRMLWQYGESRALEPLLPPPSLNWGPAAIYCSGQTGIGSRLAVRGPLVLPWIWLQRFSPGRKIHPHTCPHWWCLRKSTLCHLFKKIDTVHISAEAFLGSPDQCREYPLSTIY